MKIHPLNVIKLLLLVFPPMNTLDSEVNDVEPQLGNNFEKILMHALNEETSTVEETHAECSPKPSFTATNLPVRNMTNILASIGSK